MFKTKESPKPSTPAQLLRLKEAELQARELEMASQIRQTKLMAELDQVRSTVDQEVKAKRSSDWSATVQRWTSLAVPFLPLVLVNTMAVFGQLGWGRHNLVQVGSSENDAARWAVALLFAATLESIALFLAYYANRALDRGDSATALYLGAFAVAAIVAGVNYSHYASPDKISLFGLVDAPSPTAMSVVFALCSLASPWLWRIKHRDANRNKLHALGVIDSKAVRLSMASKIYYPIRSFLVVRKAVWDRETNPIKAVENWEAQRAERLAAKVDAKARKALQEAPSTTETVVEVVEEPETPALVSVALTAPTAPALPPAAIKHPAAWDALVTTTNAGNPVSQRQLAANYLGNNRHYARDVIAAYRAWKGMNPSANGASAATP